MSFTSSLDNASETEQNAQNISKDGHSSETRSAFVVHVFLAGRSSPGSAAADEERREKWRPVSYLPFWSGSAILGLPALVALPAAVCVLPLPGSSRVTTPSPAASCPTGARPVVMGSERKASSTFFPTLSAATLAFGSLIPLMLLPPSPSAVSGWAPAPLSVILPSLPNEACIPTVSSSKGTGGGQWSVKLDP